jgi:hypothetical protein
MSTPQPAAEEAAHAHARASVAVDLARVFGDMTPEAFAKAIQMGNVSWTLTGYDLAFRGGEGGDHVFDITYQSDLGPLTIQYRFRDIDGAWRIVDIERLS